MGIEFNRDKFYEAVNGNNAALQSMLEALTGIGDHRETGTIECIRAIKSYHDDLVKAVEDNKKIVWHEFLMFPEIFYGLENVHPYMMEFFPAILPIFDPQGLDDFIDIAESMGMPAEICPVDKGPLGAIVSGIMPPVHFVTAPTMPCDSALSMYQILTRLLDAPVHQVEGSYYRDKRSLDLYTKEMWKMIHHIEEVCKTKMDWDKSREHIKWANEAQQAFIEENEMRKLRPCPHPGKLGFFEFMMISGCSGSKAGSDCARFILEDSKKLAAQKKGAVPNERARILFYNPDPFYDSGVHDWMEDEYGVVSVLSFFGHATGTLIDPSTPETIVRGYAEKMSNICMSRQYRGSYEYFMDDLIEGIEGWGIDAVIIPALLQCKHGQGTHGFIRDECRKRGLPLLFVEIDALDTRPVPIDKQREDIAQFLETQVLV